MTINREIQLELLAMDYETFARWHAVNGDSLPVFHNSKWLQQQPNPTAEIWQSVRRWCENRPIPKPA